MIETRTRSLLKALLWQVLGLVTMTAVGLVMTGSVAAGGAMALANAGIGLTLYLIYERVWQRIGWGRVMPAR